MRRGGRRPGNARAAYRARLVEKVASAGPVMAGYYAAQLDRLDAGGPVVVAGWQLHGVWPGRPEGSGRWFVLGEDGGVSEVVPVRRGLDIVGWERAPDAAA